MKQMPVKFKIVKSIDQQKVISNKELLEMIKDEYPNDLNINETTIEEYLFSLKMVGIIKVIDAEIDENEKIVIYYKITEYGKSRIKYMTQWA